MIEPTITLTFLACCDRCGLRHTEAGNDSQEARQHAKDAGWNVSEWLDHYGCARQTLFCPACDRHLQASTNPIGDTP